MKFEQLDILTEEDMNFLKETHVNTESLSLDFGSLFAGGGTVDTPADVAKRMISIYELVDWDRLMSILSRLEHPTAGSYGAGGKPNCPECGNSAQNCVPADAPHMRRCADCKLVFHLPTPQTLLRVVHGPLEASKGETLSEEEVVQILNDLSGYHPDDSQPPEFITECSLWDSHLKPFMLQFNKSYKEYIQDFLDGRLDIKDYNFCIHFDDVEEESGHVWSYIMGEGREQLVSRRLFPDEDSLRKCYDAIGVERIILGVG